MTASYGGVAPDPSLFPAEHSSTTSQETKAEKVLYMSWFVALSAVYTPTPLPSFPYSPPFPSPSSSHPSFTPRTPTSATRVVVKQERREHTPSPPPPPPPPYYPSLPSHNNGLEDSNMFTDSLQELADNVCTETGCHYSCPSSSSCRV